MSRTLFVLGNAMLDESLTVPALPAPGETVVATGLHRGPGGKGLNQALAAARAGAAVRFCAPLGQDAEAAEILASLERERLVLHILRHQRPTDRSFIAVDAAGENTIVSLCGCADAVSATDAAAFIAGAGPDDVVLLQGNLSLAATTAALSGTPAQTILNPAPLRWPLGGLLPLCTLVIVNRVEAERITSLAAPADAARALLRDGAGAAIVTLGAAGCLLANEDGIVSFAATEVTALDTTGAGDAFCGTLGASRLAGLDWPEAISRSQDAAAGAVRRLGAN